MTNGMNSLIVLLLGRKKIQKNESCPSTSLKWTPHIDEAIPSTLPSQYNQYQSADSKLMQQLEETRDHHSPIRVMEAYENGAFPYAQIILAQDGS
ncbi:hypothetical protein N7494_004267 [Penicillium frequentans]|uniref:Uncharacterized protein n=1 Tax=Penicillium frequentans TaxID=3151616 RepID=A0AAD6D0B3_9EURO|nr:hypothetical protein N7494_004267 [Penicillium glabrum]